MSVIKTPVKGTNDFIPKNMRLRNKVLSIIRENYAHFGFSEIETPIVEHIENLTSNQGGENEKLIFKIMKRGAELSRALESGTEIADSGLRYDLTMPLSRFYAVNSENLPSPFKALQIGNVFRADRPQKGRFRQFMQCDIDILGDSSVLAETELVTATSSTLVKIFALAGISGFTVHVNDRRLLSAMASFSGFDSEKLESVFIILDKLDKIGKEGVFEELCEIGLSKESVEKYLSLFDGERNLSDFEKLLGEYASADVFESIGNIISASESILPEGVKIVFDPTLVRGMGYYTGTIFEVTVDNYNFAIAGGGRYDKMIGKFSGQNVPACGFSIGFERIITVLNDLNVSGEDDNLEKKAYLIDGKVTFEKATEIMKLAQKERAEGKIVSVMPMKKNAKFQIDKLMAEGYEKIERIYND